MKDKEIHNQIHNEPLNDRIFARKMARELTPQELRNIGGGTHYTESTGAGDWDSDDYVSNPYASGG